MISPVTLNLPDELIEYCQKAARDELPRDGVDVPYSVDDIVALALYERMYTRNPELIAQHASESR